MSRDPAFQWETEVLRSSRRRTEQGGSDTPGRLVDVPGDWITVREASDVTGVPAPTIRKWARRDNIPSLLEQTDDGVLRLVSMRGIEQWAEKLGRDIDSPGSGAEADQSSQDPDKSATSTPEVPEGSMIVPLDAWNRMLNQLGNLHEAGQQLAEARERAAKAETEARFLKERLADLREELEKARAPSSGSPDEASDGDVAATTASPLSIAKTFYDSWRTRRRDRR